MTKGDREFYEQNRKPCRVAGCDVGSCFFAKDNRAEFAHLCWKHPPKLVGDDPDFYEEVPY